MNINEIAIQCEMKIEEMSSFQIACKFLVENISDQLVEIKLNGGFEALAVELKKIHNKVIILK